MKPNHKATSTIILKEKEGRVYKMGSMTAIFKADNEETNKKYSVSEWWLDPHSKGSGPHHHEANIEMFYVLEGTASFLVDAEWIDAEKGSFIRIPEKTIHDFENRTDHLLGLLNFYVPGGFEKSMPSIVKWFEENE
jgi:mannose-6-phosphate isomerase-like protein (cupin superfamily)